MSRITFYRTLKYNKRLGTRYSVCIYNNLKCILTLIPPTPMFFEPDSFSPFFVVCFPVEVLKWERGLVYVTNITELFLCGLS
jgi:hypothetical protein